MNHRPHRTMHRHEFIAAISRKYALSCGDARSSAGPRMEPLWSPVVANGGNRRQIEESRKPQKQAKTVATGCHPLPENFRGKGRVDATSLLLKRGSPSSLRKGARVRRNPRGARDSSRL